MKNFGKFLGATCILMLLSMVAMAVGGFGPCGPTSWISAIGLYAWILSVPVLGITLIAGSAFGVASLIINRHK